MSQLYNIIGLDGLQTISDTTPFYYQAPMGFASDIFLRIVSSTSLLGKIAVTQERVAKASLVTTWTNVPVITSQGVTYAANTNITCNAAESIHLEDSAGVTFVRFTPSSGSGSAFFGSADHTQLLIAARAAQASTPSLLHPSAWTINHNPGVNTKATATQASAGTGLKNVLTAIICKLSGGTTAPAAVNVSANIIDGSSGGTAIWSVTVSLQAVAGLDTGFTLSNLWIPGSAATAMTVEFSAAGGANTFESVNASGQVTA